MINWIKRDFRNVREALGYLVNKDIPFGIAVLYYIIVGTIASLLFPLIWLGLKIYNKILMWQITR